VCLLRGTDWNYSSVLSYSLSQLAQVFPLFSSALQQVFCPLPTSRSPAALPNITIRTSVKNADLTKWSKLRHNAAPSQCCPATQHSAPNAHILSSADPLSPLNRQLIITLLSSLPKILPRHQPTFTRRTSGHFVKTFRAAKVSDPPNLPLSLSVVLKLPVRSAPFPSHCITPPSVCTVHNSNPCTVHTAHRYCCHLLSRTPAHPTHWQQTAA